MVESAVAAVAHGNVLNRSVQAAVLHQHCIAAVDPDAIHQATDRGAGTRPRNIHVSHYDIAGTDFHAINATPIGNIDFNPVGDLSIDVNIRCRNGKNTTRRGREDHLGIKCRAPACRSGRGGISGADTLHIDVISGSAAF